MLQVPLLPHLKQQRKKKPIYSTNLKAILKSNMLVILVGLEFRVNTTAQVMCHSQHINERNKTPTFAIKYDKSDILFYTEYTMFSNLLANTKKW
jgi:hypothetical protein